MTPLIETLTIVVITVIVILMITWLFMSKSKKDTAEDDENNQYAGHIDPEGEKGVDASGLVGYEKIQEIEQKATQKTSVVCVYPPFVKSYANGINSVSYEATNWCVKDKDGKYYVLVKSSKDAYFYIKNGNRRYVKITEVAIKTIEELKALYEVSFE